FDREDRRVDFVLRDTGRATDHDRVRARARRLRRQGGGFLRRLLVRIEQRHVKRSLASPLQDRLVHVHTNAPARKAVRATIIPYFVTRWDRAGFAAEWRAA